MSGSIPRGMAGYNSSSFYPPTSEAPVKGGYDERQLNSAEMGVHDDGWDVYADFNNTGPRYSSTLGTNSSGYQKLPVGASKPETPKSEISSSGPVELVTVPALGGEWKSSELRAMTKSAKREDRWDRWGTKWRSFRRDENGFCGIPWMTRRIFVIILFAVCCVVGIILAFTVPRVPTISFNIDNPLNGSSNIKFSSVPANFTFGTQLNLQVDTHSNFLPLRFNRLHATIFDSDTNNQIGDGEVNGKTFKAKAFTDFFMPVTFKYTAINNTDITWNDVHKACLNKRVIPDNEQRPPLKLRLVMDMDIAGLVTHPTAGISISADCPFQLAMNAS